LENFNEIKLKKERIKQMLIAGVGPARKD